MVGSGHMRVYVCVRVSMRRREIVCTHNFDLHLTKSRKEDEAGN